MTRRDYVFLAECFRRSLNSDTPMTYDMRVGIERAARDMAHSIALVNPKFDKNLFLQNVGVLP